MMHTNNKLFKTWTNPRAHAFGTTALEFLERVNEPTHIHIQGRDQSRCRVVTTLLHGNEPSGLQAILHLIQHGVQPAVDIHCFIPNVAAAKAPPGFYYRMLPGERDLNRSFHPPYLDHAGAVANALLESIRALQPECAIDIHNTSGEGPSFSVVTFDDWKHDCLTALFTDKLIVTDLKLGAIMEISETIAPTVTIECGGAGQSESIHIAIHGLKKYFSEADLFNDKLERPELDLYHNPIRLEFANKHTATLSYGKAADTNVQLTLLKDIEQLNFGQVPKHTTLGFCRDVSFLCATDAAGTNRVDDFFEVHDGYLRTKTPLKLFMVTGRSDIAVSDCLFYFVRP